MRERVTGWLCHCEVFVLFVSFLTVSVADALLLHLGKMQVFALPWPWSWPWLLWLGLVGGGVGHACDLCTLSAPSVAGRQTAGLWAGPAAALKEAAALAAAASGNNSDMGVSLVVSFNGATVFHKELGESGEVVVDDDLDSALYEEDLERAEVAPRLRHHGLATG